MQRPLLSIIAFAAALLAGVPEAAFASAGAPLETLNLTNHAVGYAAIIIFVVAYSLVMGEEFTHLRKSKPVLLAAGLIWIMIGWAYAANHIPHVAEIAIRHNILEFAELFLFLLVAMTYINAMEERQLFEALRVRLVCAGFSFRKLFWITGLLAFCISPVADNMTTALLMCAVVMAIGKNNAKFVNLSCINIVVAANAGGAFSPFGDITTLMVWQKGLLHFNAFFHLFIPAAVNWLVPALLMSFAVPKINPAPCEINIHVKRGGYVIIGLFLLTILTAISFHNFLQLPPMAGMMTGLAFLQIFGYFLKKTHKNGGPGTPGWDPEKANQLIGDTVPFDVFKNIARAEWDTLMFFYGVILCVGGLGCIGYLAMASQTMYTGWGATSANITVGLLSAVVDNIPVMFAVLTMNPEMSAGQWLLVTLTAGVGGSLLSIGSAAGVALMGQARGMYTFFGHLKWTPAIALGYAASIYIHFLINAKLF